MFSCCRNRTEDRIVRIFWNDGLLDLLAGMGIILISVAWLCDLVPLGAMAPAILVPLWKPLRTRITQPRLGFVELSETLQERNRRFLQMSIWIGVATFLTALLLYLVAVNRGPVLKSGIAALPALIIGLLAVMTAAITSLGRFVMYGAALMLSGVAVSVLDEEPGWSLLAGGLVIILGGGIALHRFLSRYPTASNEDRADEADSGRA